MDELLQCANGEDLSVGSFITYRAHSAQHKDSQIGGTSREIRRNAARRDRQPVKPQQKPAVGF